MNNAMNAGSPSERNVFEPVSIRGLALGSTVVELPISDLLPADSPRTSGLNAGYIRMLAESVTPLPPIVVHRATMRVVDGWHRVRAVESRGETTIAAVYFDGDLSEAFVVAVKLNVAHGLPLSLADRKAAAHRILLTHPDWSDRSIAAIAGISHPTVAAIRNRSIGKIDQSTPRVGRNGVLRRLDGQQGRLRAAELFTADPNASARTVASAAGVSVTTAKEVRKQLRAGQRPAQPRKPASDATSAPTTAREHQSNPPAPVTDETDSAELLQRLRRDPSLRFSESGRKLLRSLETPFGDSVDWNALVQNLPSHCTPSIAELARQRSRDWQHLARLLDRR
ncbi:transcriptional regulator [Nocardia sp. NPDC003482]